MAANDTITKGKLVCIMFGMICETGQYMKYFRIWRARPDVNKTLTTFQLQLIEYQEALQTLQQTSLQSCYYVGGGASWY